MLLIGSVSPDHTKPSQEVPVTPNQTTKSDDSGPREHDIKTVCKQPHNLRATSPPWWAGITEFCLPLLVGLSMAAV